MSISLKDLSEYLDNQETYEQLLEDIESILGRVLNSDDILSALKIKEAHEYDNATILEIYRYAVKTKKYSPSYVEKLANKWNRSNVDSDMIEELSESMKIVFETLKIKRKIASEKEKEYLDKWMLEYNLSIELIKEACKRTISTIGSPSFPYTDTILTNWKNSGIVSVEQLKEPKNTKKIDKKTKRPKPELTEETYYTERVYSNGPTHYQMDQFMGANKFGLSKEEIEVKYGSEYV